MSRIFLPREGQPPMMDHIRYNRRCGIWAPMGGGKTVCTETVLDQMDLVEDVYPVLVLATKRVARTVWGPELKKWKHLEHLRASIVLGTAAERERALRANAEYFCTNYDNLVWLAEELGDDWPFKTVVADELTKLKSFRLRQGTQRGKALAKYAFTKIDRFIGLTGTPSPNGLKDLWGQTWFLDQGAALGRTFTSFQERWFQKSPDGYGLTPMEHTEKEIHERIRKLYITVKSTQVDEPIFSEVYVDLPEHAREVYKTMKRAAFAELRKDGKATVASNGGVKTSKLRQIANGFMFTGDPEKYQQFPEERRLHENLHDEKIAALESIIDEANGMPVLVAYNFVPDLAKLKKAFPQGRVLDDKQSTVDDWNAGKIPILFAHPACLHPDTEVLTEFRGWRKIVDVSAGERVFDGIEFVRHSGCVFSGHKDVIDVFGITMTPGHKLLIDGVWTEGKDASVGEDAKRKAQYTFAGDDRYLSKMLALQEDVKNSFAELPQAQSQKEHPLSEMFTGNFPPSHRHTYLEFLARFKIPGTGQIRQKLRWSWDRCLPVVDALQKLLRGHGANVSGGLHNRTHKRECGLFEKELQMGVEVRPTGEQTDDEALGVSRAANTSGRTLPDNRPEPVHSDNKAQRWHERQSGRCGGEGVDIQKESKKSDVYDLVDCGPRHCFVVRNSKGEVFISHNSAGHGLNLQDGGNIIAFFGLDWNLELYLQIIERIGPLRQKQSGYDRPVFVYHIIARSTIELDVLERLRSKRSVQDVLMAAMERDEKGSPDLVELEPLPQAA